MSKAKKIQASTSERKSVVFPIIAVDGQPHPFQEMEAAGTMPELTSVGYARIEPEGKYYVSYVIKSRGSKVTSIEVSEPDLKLICEDSAKCAFVQELDDSGEDTNDDA